VIAAHGGLNQIVFHKNGEIAIRPIVLTGERIHELNSHLMLFYSGIKRTANDVASTYVHELDDKKRQMRIMKDLVDESIALLNSGNDIKGFGELLHEAWQVKRSISSNISNSHVDAIYAKAREAGAIGGKLAGAGGGGFFMMFAPPEKHADIQSALGNLINVPFKFDFSGSQIIYYNIEEDYSVLERERANQSVDSARELSQIVGKSCHGRGNNFMQWPSVRAVVFDLDGTLYCGAAAGTVRLNCCSNCEVKGCRFSFAQIIQQRHDRISVRS
jgi:D-glycero-alpha-D-manno-heptose-7-phosphate kinase